ncbi:MAG TPA: TetR/AcrR family transcriptional regulator [Usitatibacter sp.]|nr:TetR/AcrR family transcriptional regulator [Usitatibacter sp.]
MSRDPGKRERILAAAMRAFIEHGFADATTLEIATRARVSKRELYALVGNKEEMLAACIAGRGSRMRLPEGFPAPADRASLRTALRRFGATILRELTDPNVAAVFRLGIAEAKRSPGIGRSLDAMGRQPARAALEALLRPAQASGLLADGDLDAMMSHFVGLLWGDLLVWILLGVDKAPGAAQIERRADAAASVFLAAHGRG